jgi:pyrroloquinoline quinone (PQQ) biosynthesis protein C
MTNSHYYRGHTVDQTGNIHSSLVINPAIEELKAEVFSHPAVDTLNRFAENLQKAPLAQHEMHTLLASEGMFVLEVPPGIVRLASRMTDELFETAPFEATGMAARILFAAVDEYGLNAIETGLLPSHHRLYADMATHWGISTKALSDRRYIVPSAIEFASVIREFYRERPIIEALGFHVANEATAPLDFGVFLKTFRRFRGEYGLQDNDPILNFLLVHDDVEVSHREMGVEAVQLYTGGDAALIEQARIGVQAYMESYGRFFAELNDAIFGRAARQPLKAIA